MKKTQDYEPHVAMEINIGDLRASSSLFRAGRHQDNACTKEHGKKSTHLSFKEDPLQDQDREIEMGMRPHKRWLRHSYGNIVRGCAGKKLGSQPGLTDETHQDAKKEYSFV